MKLSCAALAVLAIATFLTGCPRHSDFPLYRVSEVGTYTSYYPDRLNNSGRVLRNFLSDSGNLEIGVWKEGRLTMLPMEQGYAYSAPVYTDTGSVIAIKYTSTGPVITQWVDSIPTSTPQANEMGSIFLNAVNESLQLVGTSHYAYQVPFRWDHPWGTENLLSLFDHQVNQADVEDINESGVSVGWEGKWIDSNYCFRPFQTDGNDVKGIPGFPVGDSGRDLSVSDSGVVVVGNHQEMGQSKGFPLVLRNGQAYLLDVAESDNAKAFDINENGWIVGEANMIDGSRRAVLWKPDTAGDGYECIFLDDTVLPNRHKRVLEKAFAINDSNEILAIARESLPTVTDFEVILYPRRVIANN